MSGNNVEKPTEVPAKRILPATMTASFVSDEALRRSLLPATEVTGGSLDDSKAMNDTGIGDSILSGMGYIEKDGLFVPSIQRLGGTVGIMSQLLGINPSNDVVKQTARASVEVERIDIMPKRKAVAILKYFLDNEFITDNEKAIAANLILKHFALNSSSTRTPENVVYDVLGRPLDMSLFRSKLGDDSRRFVRAFADEIAGVIRDDLVFATKMSKRYGVSSSDAPYCFDAADCQSNLTREARQRVTRIKANVLRMAATFDNRDISASLVEHQDAHGAPTMLQGGDIAYRA